ncbi:hypothetical protein V1514DRAFT_326698 [Lipomyces japonicus]|uniref:uncharacterized protein n=1 Tax=Lipomyces japonicus TaxID=56871 RepID=UPI0034CFCED1
MLLSLEDSASSKPCGPDCTLQSARHNTYDACCCYADSPCVDPCSFPPCPILEHMGDSGSTACTSCDEEQCELEDGCDKFMCNSDNASTLSSTAETCSTCLASNSLVRRRSGTFSTISSTKTPIFSGEFLNLDTNKYCHWGDDCSFAFTSPSDLDEHLRTTHISFLKHQHENQLKENYLQQHQYEHYQQQQEYYYHQNHQNQQNHQNHQNHQHGVQNYERLQTSQTHQRESLPSIIPCQWESCDVLTDEFDSLLSHIKTEHVLPCELNHKSSDFAINPLKSAAELHCHWNKCSDSYHDQSSLNAHVLDHMSTFAPYLQCEWDTCQFTTLDTNQLVSHVVHDHISSVPHVSSAAGSNIPETVKESISKEEHDCQWIIGSDTICSKVFSNTHDLSEHIIASHVGSRKQEYRCAWHGCERNHKPFNQRQKIIRHLQTHTHNRPFVCTICGRQFAEQIVLTQHLRVHSGERPYRCKVCGKRFAASTALSVHLRTHTGEKPLRCKWPGCGKFFSESSNLAKHMRTHTPDRNFKCPVESCEKAFVRHDQLVRHMRTHSGKVVINQKTVDNDRNFKV